MELVDTVRQFIEQNLPRRAEPLVVGVSGGPDSVALLRALVELREELRQELRDELRTESGPRLIAAHFNHGIRGADADADERYVDALCEEWHVPLLVERADVPALAEAHRLSLEEAARRARYTFLAQVARQAGARSIAVAHNADDQVETVLMHFLRGTALAGLRGMRPVSPLSEYHLLTGQPGGLQIVRPLLSVPRTEIESYCRAQGLSPRQDLSNLDTQYLRNRVRQELIPVLEGFNPGVRQVIRRSAEVAAGDYEIVVAAGELAWRQVVRQESGQGILFDLRGWRGLPLGLQRLLLRQAIVRLRPRLRDHVRFDIVTRAVAVAAKGNAGAKATLPGRLLLHVSYESLTMTSLHDRGPLPEHPVLLGDEPLPVAVPGRTALPESEWELVARVLGPGEWNALAVHANPDEWQAFIDPAALPGPAAPAGERLDAAAAPNVAAVDRHAADARAADARAADTCAAAPRAADTRGADDRAAGSRAAVGTPALPALVLRQRRPGDRFQPLGMPELVRLTEFMINAKVAQVWRDAVPILAAGPEAAEIVWVCGLRLDERVRVRDTTTRLLHLRFVRAPGGADGGAS